MMAHSLTFDAWRLCEGNARDTIPLDIDGDLTVDEAVNSALSCGVVLCHKDVLLVRQTDAGRGKAWLHCYAIKKKSNPTWRWNPVTLRNERVERLYPAPLFTIPIEAFAPVEKFRITRETTHAEIVGIDPDLVEQPQ